VQPIKVRSPIGCEANYLGVNDRSAFDPGRLFDADRFDQSAAFIV